MILIVVMLCVPCIARGAIASKEYVVQQNETKVDTSATSVQTMAGDYTVSGSFKVPTPPLPTPE